MFPGDTSADTVNYTTQRHVMGPVLVIMLDPQPHNPVGFGHSAWWDLLWINNTCEAEWRKVRNPIAVVLYISIHGMSLDQSNGVVWLKTWNLTLKFEQQNYLKHKLIPTSVSHTLAHSSFHEKYLKAQKNVCLFFKFDTAQNLSHPGLLTCV